MARKVGSWIFADATERNTFGTAQGVLVGDLCTLESDNTAHSFDGSVWVPVGGGGGSRSATLMWGGFLSSTGQYLDTGSAGAGGVSGAWDTDGICGAPFNGSFTEITVTWEPAPNGQVISVWVDDVEVATGTMPVSAAGASRTYVLTLSATVSVTAGQGLGVKLKSGSPPSQGTGVWAILEES